MFRTVRIMEIDNRIDAKKAFLILFLEDSSIKCEARLKMGVRILSLTQHWLEHNDELFTDVFSELR